MMEQSLCIQKQWRNLSNRRCLKDLQERQLPRESIVRPNPIILFNSAQLLGRRYQLLMHNFSWLATPD